MIEGRRAEKGRRLIGVRYPVRCMGADDRGATIVEFALIAAPFFALLIGILVIAVVFFAQEGLETACEKASRLILTGSAQSSGFTQAQFQTAACKSLPPYMNCSNLMVDVETASSFSSVNTSAPTITFDKNGNVTNTWNYTPAAGGTIVIIRLMYIWPVPTGPLGFNLATLSNGQRLLIATSVIQTEPFS